MIRVLVVALAAALGATAAAPRPAAAAPRVHFLDVESGANRGGPGGLGAPVTIYGTGFGAARGASTVTIGGRPVARYLVWGRRAAVARLRTIVVQPGPGVTGGPVVVSVGGHASTQAVAFSVIRARVLAVSPGGSDAARCTVAAPCATVGHVVNDVMRPGDLLLVRGGSYAESEVWIRGDQGDSGEPGRQKTIAAYPGERVSLTNAARPWIVDADHVTIAGLRFLNGKSTGVPDTGLPGHRGDRFIGNAFRGEIGFSALDLHGDGHLAAGNDCEVAGSTVGTQGHCFYVSYGHGVRLRDNTAAGATGYGIHVFDQERAPNDFRRTISDLVIDGNLLRGSRERSGLILAMGDEGGRGNLIRGVTVRGNLLTRNNHAGMVVGANVTGVRVSGNRFVQNGRTGLSVADEPTIDGVTVSGNVFTQSANPVCRSNCDWFPLAHADVGARARGVAFAADSFGPGPPVVRGARAAERPGAPTAPGSPAPG